MIPPEKSILVHVHTCCYVRPKESKLISRDDSGVDATISSDVFVHSSNIYNPVPTQLVNKCFIIEHTDSGLKLSTIFADLDEEAQLALKDTASGVTDSSLYVLGGRPKNSYYHPLGDKQSRTIRCVDIRNYQADGWRNCKPLEVGVDGSYAANYMAFLGKYIYIFLPSDGRQGDKYFCYIYDTTKEAGFYVEAPPYLFRSSYRLQPDICVPLDGRGMMVIDLLKTEFHIHDPHKNLWHRCPNYQSVPMPSFLFFHLRSALNGILYICDTTDFPTLYLSAYDCWKGKRLYHVQLPELCKPSLKAVNYFKDQDIHRPTHMVAVSDSKLCFLWIFMFRLFCAEVFVPPGSDDPVPELLEVRHFHIADPEGVTINNCLAVDASLGQMAKVSKLFDQRRDATICPVGKNSKAFEETRREPKQSEEENTFPSLRHCSMKLTGKQDMPPLQRCSMKLTGKQNMPSLQRCSMKVTAKQDMPSLQRYSMKLATNPVPRPYLHVYPLSKQLVFHKLTKKTSREKVHGLRRQKLLRKPISAPSTLSTLTPSASSKDFRFEVTRSLNLNGRVA